MRHSSGTADWIQEGDRCYRRDASENPPGKTLFLVLLCKRKRESCSGSADTQFNLSQEFVDSTAGRHAAPAAASAGPPILAAAAAPEDGIATVDPAASPTLTSTCAAERPDAAAAAAAATRQQSVPPFAEPSFECGDCSALHASEGELASHRLRHCCGKGPHQYLLGF